MIRTLSVILLNAARRLACLRHGHEWGYPYAGKGYKDWMRRTECRRCGLRVGATPIEPETKPILVVQLPGGRTLPTEVARGARELHIPAMEPIGAAWREADDPFARMASRFTQVACVPTGVKTADGVELWCPEGKVDTWR